MPGMLVGFAGEGCVGKTTLAKTCIEPLETLGLRVGVVGDVARRSVANAVPPPPEHPTSLARRNLHWMREILLMERALQQEHDVVLVDGACIQSLAYAVTPPSSRDDLTADELMELEQPLQICHHYDVLMLLEREWSYIADGVRIHDEREAAAVRHCIVQSLDRGQVSYRTLRGSLEGRTLAVIDGILERLTPDIRERMIRANDMRCKM